MADKWWGSGDAPSKEQIRDRARANAKARGKRSYSVKVFGLDDLDAQFQEFSAAVQKGILRKVTKVGAAIVLQRAKAYCPVSTTRSRDGQHLRDSLDLWPISKARQARGQVGWRVVTPKRGGIGVKPGEKWFYPVVLEYGGRKKDGTTIPARPYMRPALAHSKDSVLIAMRMALPGEIEKAGLRKSRRAMKKAEAMAEAVGSTSTS